MAVNFNLTFSLILAGIIASLLWVLFLLIKRRRASSYKINKILAPMTRARVNNIIIPDGIGGILEIDQLHLLAQGVLIIETYPISGHLFGAEEIDQWTQLVKGRSYKFANPLRHIRTSRQAIMTLMPNIPVFYSVIFSADASFPKGKPEGMSLLSTLADDLKPIQSHPKRIEQTQQAWDKLLRIARKNNDAITVGEEF